MLVVRAGGWAGGAGGIDNTIMTVSSTGAPALLMLSSWPGTTGLPCARKPDAGQVTSVPPQDSEKPVGLSGVPLRRAHR